MCRFWSGTPCGAVVNPTIVDGYRPFFAAPIPYTKPPIITAIDLGQVQDFTAFCADEVEEVGVIKAKATIKHHHIRDLRRWPLGTSYMDIAAELKKVFGKSPLNKATLLIDETGVGRAVCDILRKEKIECGKFVPCSVTSGASQSPQVDGSWHVSKLRLVGALIAAMQSGRVHLPKSHPETRHIIEELQNFRMKETAVNNLTFEARQGKKDDLIFSLSLCVWYAEKASKRANVW